MRVSGIKEQAHYDAFISYRHLPDDKKVAQRLQKLLERRKIADEQTGRKRNLHIFRDQSELPTSSDLGADIRSALEKSRFLIILYSKTTKDSRWCMEELHYFRSLHGNTNQNILPLILDGEPDEVFPEVLCRERRQVTEENGEIHSVMVNVEPLGADIRADSLYGKLKKLDKTEHMRIAAPILACRFDDLYRRALRQKVQKGIFAAGIVCLVAFLIGMLFYNRHRANLTDAAVYHVMAEQYAKKGDWQSALLYESEAAKRDTSLSSASLAASILLQEKQWACVSCMEERKFIGSNGVIWSMEETGQIEEEAQEEIRFRDSNGDFYLFDDTNVAGKYAVYDRNRRRRAVLEDVGSIQKESYGQPCWAFYQKGRVTLYHPQKDLTCVFETDSRTEAAMLVHVVPAGERTCFVLDEQADSVSVYRIDFEKGTGQLLAKEKLSAIFGGRFEREVSLYGERLSGFYQFMVSPSEDILVAGRSVEDIGEAWSDVAVLQLSDLKCRRLISGDHYALNGIAFCDDADCFALAYGNGYGKRYAGGYAAVYDGQGGELFSTGIDESFSCQGAVFRESESKEIIVWGDRELRFWNYGDGKEYAVSLKLPNHIRAVACTEDAHCVVESGGLYEYDMVAFAEKDPEGEPDKRYDDIKLMEKGSEGITLLVREKLLIHFESDVDENGIPLLRVSLLDQEGNEYDRLELSGEGGTLSEFGWEYCFSQDLSTLYLCLQGLELYRTDILMDARKFSPCEALQRSYWLYGLCPVRDGIAVLSIDSRLYYYGKDTVFYQELGNPRTAGQILGMEANGENLFAMVSDSREGLVFEFWDMETLSCIADFRPEGEGELTKFGFVRPDVLLYGTDEKAEYLRIISNAPDARAQKALRAICGMTIEDGRVTYVQEPFDGNLGNWGGLQVHYQ